MRRAQLARRSPWLADDPSAADLQQVTAYRRAVLVGDDAVPPAAEIAERAVMLLAGILNGCVSGEIEHALDDLDNSLRAGLVDEVKGTPPCDGGWRSR
jgi:hypothetical protein